MAEAYICDYIRTLIGGFGGSLSSLRADILALLSQSGCTGSAG
jgi:acetyl-CoA acetyltransferase